MTFAELWHETSQLNGDTSAGTTARFSASFYGGSGNITAYTPVVGTWAAADDVNATHQQIIRDRWTVAQAGAASSLRVMQPAVVPANGVTYRVRAVLDITPVITSGVYIQTPVFLRNASNTCVLSVRSENSAANILITSDGATLYSGAVAGSTVLVDSRVTMTGSTLALTVLVNSVQVYSASTAFAGAIPATFEAFQWAQSAVGASMPGMYSLVIE